jgi:hypothetical protein
VNYKRFMELLCLASKNKLAADPRRQPQTFCSADLAEQKMHSLREKIHSAIDVNDVFMR